ncbi:ADP-ribosylglycohydrolase family protein [Paenibacillus koleovorans]|uniref:ADP-ribosylglycohydrolase family protein n=1 Tax=Paenibacillus koleovorans TaxID=121608 RepID=UPI000FD75F68|nr:ADP-ribosylglycohydrolase family protein [Paenibacillus koleovorans]
MKLTLQQYKEKVLGCWTGKNIGGTLGAPFECKRGVFDVWFYTQDTKGEPLPNDDLDLQLVWLNAVEAHGRNVNATILGEYWLSFITPNWGEYGAGKNNMRAGLVPPLSGHVNNRFKDSNGAYIRSEIWACLAPGNPDIAVRYAYEDAIVDHSGEGVYAEVFCAAVQSAAFVESDVQKLIQIGLSYIPDDCGVAKGIRSALIAYNSGKTWQEARIQVLTDVPGSFGILGMDRKNVPDDVPIGPMGYDAPSNIGITLIGWLYGEGDFGKSICIANNCGEDTDCTAATVGSILGIIYGKSGIPKEWKDPIGDQIKTLCINLGDQGVKIPKSVTELTDRILRQTPLFLGTQLCDVVNASEGYTIEVKEGDDLLHQAQRFNAWENRSFKDHVLARSPYVVKHSFVILDAYLRYEDDPYMAEGVSKRFTLTIENRLYTQQVLTVKLHLPNVLEASPSARFTFPLENYHCNIGKEEIGFTLTCGASAGLHGSSPSTYEAFLEISSLGRPTKGLIPIVLLHNPIAANKSS